MDRIYHILRLGHLNLELSWHRHTPLLHRHFVARCALDTDKLATAVSKRLPILSSRGSLGEDVELGSHETILDLPSFPSDERPLLA